MGRLSHRPTGDNRWVLFDAYVAINLCRIILLYPIIWRSSRSYYRRRPSGGCPSPYWCRSRPIHRFRPMSVYADRIVVGAKSIGYPLRPVLHKLLRLPPHLRQILLPRIRSSFFQGLSLCQPLIQRSKPAFPKSAQASPCCRRPHRQCIIGCRNLIYLRWEYVNSPGHPAPHHMLIYTRKRRGAIKLFKK